MDLWLPAVIALAATIVGAIIAVLGGLFTGSAQARREHEKWLREKRLEAYVPAVAFLTDYEHAYAGHHDLNDRISGAFESMTQDERRLNQKTLDESRAQVWTYRERLSRETAAVTILGPEDVAIAIREWEKTARHGRSKPWEVGNMLPPVIAAMRQALEIPGAVDFRAYGNEGRAWEDQEP